MILNDFLPKGKKNAISADTLVDRLGLKSTRELRKVIQQARTNGALIASDESGYYVPETRAEIVAYVRRYEHMAVSIFEGLKAARRAFDDADGQLSFDFD